MWRCREVEMYEWNRSCVFTERKVLEEEGSGRNDDSANTGR